MPLAEAVTQLSFLEFLQRCNLLIAPLQPSQLPVPISPLDAAVQTSSPCDASQDASTQTSDQPVSSLSFDVAVQTSFHSVHTSSLDAAVQTIPHSTLSQDVSTQMGSRSASSFSVDVFVQTPTRSTVLHDVSTQLPLTEFFIGCIFSNDPLDRQNFNRQRPSSVQNDIGSVSPPLLPDIVTTCTLSSSSLDSEDHVRTMAPRALLQPPPGLEQYAPHPGLAIDAHLCTPHGIPVKAAPQRPRLRSAISVTPPQPPACTIHVGTHYARSATTGKRSAKYCSGGNPQSCRCRSSCRDWPFFKTASPRSSWSTLVNPNLKSTVVLIQLTVISCIINFVFPSFNGIQAQRAEILPTLSPLRVESSMRLFFRKPVIMFRTSPISSLRTLATRTSLSCSTRTPLILTLSHSMSTPQEKVLGVWSCSSFEVSCDVRLFLVHRLLPFAQYTFTMSWLRNVMHLLSSSSAFMDI